MMRLFEGLRRESIERAPPSIRNAVLRVVASVEADERPSAEDLAAALLWTLERRAHDRKRPRKKRTRSKKNDRWASEEDFKVTPARPASSTSSDAASMSRTAFGQRLDAQEQVRAQENSSVRRVARRMGVKPSRVKTDAMGRRVQILGDDQ